jgi:myo-inositol-1(or 4)-monophosphatase
MQPLLNIAVRAARRAGDLIVRNVDRVPTLGVRSKSRNDFVTEVDQLAERDIIETIRRTHPDHGFLGEESGRSGGDEFVWIIDPLDGTTNFLHGFPVFAVSLAVERRGRLEHGVVYDPMRQELYTASRGDGAQLDGKRIRVSRQTTLEGALVGTGFPYRSNVVWLDSYMAMLRVVMEQTAGIRRPGAAALDLAYVAAGRLDAFWEIGLNAWDTAAGTLLITEAGGRVGNLAGGEYRQRGHILAGTPKVFEAMIECLGPHVPVGLREA